MTDSCTPTDRRILVVDDNPAIHSDFRKILCPAADDGGALAAVEARLFGPAPAAARPASFQVDCAAQGQAGLALVQKGVAGGDPYAVVFLDMRMPPGWDGIETSLRIWEAAPETQVVICTAYSDYSWEEMTTRLGLSDRWVILKKPFDNLEVIQLAHALTEKWRLGRAARLKREQLEAMAAARTRELQTANEQLKIEMAQRERTEEALRQSQKMEALGQLAGGIAHDFNNLLTVIRGCVDALLAEKSQPPETRHALEEIDLATERAARLTSQILMFSRKKRMQPEYLDLNQLMVRTGSLLHRLLAEQIDLRLEPGATPVVVHGDPVMLEQVLLNLAMNSRDAMPKGGQLTMRTADVRVDAARAMTNPQARAGRFVCLSVADTGTGIDAAALPHLFDPFFTTKGPGKGTGLGLSTVYGIVQQHKGWIEVQSRPGHGATFTIFLPVAAAPSEPGPAPQADGELPRGTETILLVEDDPVVHRLAHKFLQRQGYRVFDAHTGKEALAVWSEHGQEINLLLTDMVMPGKLSGRELARTLQAQDSRLKVIYTTGYSVDALNMDQLLEEGVNFIPKPYSPEKLARLIRRCLDSQPAGATAVSPAAAV